VISLRRKILLCNLDHDKPYHRALLIAIRSITLLTTSSCIIILAMNDISLSIIIPAYNEESTIAGTLREINSYIKDNAISSEIIVVDDGSWDTTKHVLNKLEPEIPNLKVLHHETNKGKGAAVRTGMLTARGERILFTDADNSTPITELPNLNKSLDEGFDIAIASRAVPGAVRVVHQPTYRELGGKLLNLFIRMFAVPKIRDTQCGFKLFKRRAAKTIFSMTFINRFSFDVEVLYLARKLGYKVAELPVRWTHHPDSKVHPFRDGVYMIIDIIRMRLHKYPILQEKNK